MTNYLTRNGIIKNYCLRLHPKDKIQTNLNFWPYRNEVSKAENNAAKKRMLQQSNGPSYIIAFPAQNGAQKPKNLSAKYSIDFWLTI